DKPGIILAMRALLSWSIVVVTACASGESVELPTDDGGVVITGAGGAGATTSSSSSATTSATSSTSGTGGAGGAGGGATSTGAGGQIPTCPDLGVGEPNESENNAFALKASAISDCDGDGGM